MLSVDWETVRLFLHVLGATIWVGGQITLATLVPALRGHGRDITRAAARQFNVVAWPAFVLLLGTGVWNMVAVGDTGGSYRTTLSVKLGVVALSGVSAAAHAVSKSTAALAVWGTLTGLSALAALFLGIMLAG